MPQERPPAREIGAGTFWLFVAGAFVVLSLVVLATMAAFGVGLFSAATADVRGQTGAREQTVGDGSYRVANYDDFHARCNAVTALDQKITLTEHNITLDQASRDTAQLYVDQAALRGQQNQRADLAGQYNARAGATATSGQFRASNLPDRIGTETPACD